MTGPFEKCDESRGLLLASGSRNVRVLLLKTLDAAGRVDQLLLTGEKWVAARADFDAQHVAFNGRARLESMSACTVDSDGMVVGVDTGFHCSPIYRGRSAREPKEMATAASLGHETIYNYRGNPQKRKMAANFEGRKAVDGYEMK